MVLFWGLWVLSRDQAKIHRKKDEPTRRKRTFLNLFIDKILRLFQTGLQIRYRWQLGKTVTSNNIRNFH